MEFNYVIRSDYKPSKMFLANPQKDYVGVISNAKNVKLDIYFNNIWELNFVVYEYEDGEYNELYDKIVKMRLVEVQDIGWFQILSASETKDGTTKERYKNVQCCLLENSLIYRKIHNISGVFALYDVTNTEKSLLHIISNECGWGIGHVSNELIGKYRTFDIDSEKIYNLLVTAVSQSFECVFIFNAYEKSISAFKLNEIGELTDIVISRKNILKEYIKDDGTEAIITKLRIKGGTDSTTGGTVDIRSVNPTGTDYLINLDYYMNSDEGWVSESLKNAWNNYQNKYSLLLPNYTNALSTYKGLVAELTTLTTELKDLHSLQDAQEAIWKSIVQNNNNKVPKSSDIDYTMYQNALNQYNAYAQQIIEKENEIANKEDEIESAKLLIDEISSQIQPVNNFTEEQLEELNMFIAEDEDYEDETFIVTETMTEQDVIDMKIELMQNGANELAKISKPQFTITIKASNLYTICDGKDELISYSEWKEKLKVGNLITIKFSENYYLTVRLIRVTIDFDDPEDLELTFSNKDRLDDELIQFAEIIADAGRAASSYCTKKYGYDSASKIMNEVRSFMNNSFNATLNKIMSNDNAEFIIDKYGAHMRQWDSNTNQYSPYQSWWTGHTLLFSSDGFASAQAGIGLFTNSNGETFYGVLAPVICGELVMSSKLYISNNSGTYTINNDGFTATATSGSNTYLVGINPNTPANIFRIAVNGTNKLYVDVTNNRLVFAGDLVGATGTFSGTVSAGKIIGSEITGGSINIGNGNFTVNSAGYLTARTGTFSGTVEAAIITGSEINGGTITGTTITGVTIKSSFTNSGDVITLEMSDVDFKVLVNVSGTSYYGSLQHSYVTFQSDANNSYARYGRTGILIQNSSGVDIFSVDSSGNLKCNLINNGTPITSNNRNMYITLLYDSNGNGAMVTATGNNFRPHSNYGDNSVSCGSPSYRWTQVFAATPTISTSDENEKDYINELSDAEKRVAQKLKKMIVTFKFKDAIKQKGDNARIHTGIIAQRVKEAFESEGLNPYDYGMFCSDTWYEKDGKAVDENENLYTKDDDGVIEVTRLGIRYEELLCFIIASL